MRVNSGVSQLLQNSLLPNSRIHSFGCSFNKHPLSTDYMPGSKVGTSLATVRLSLYGEHRLFFFFFFNIFGILETFLSEMKQIVSLI